MNINWSKPEKGTPVLAIAAEIVDARRAQGRGTNSRRLFYLLSKGGHLPHGRNPYDTLCKFQAAAARGEKWPWSFPPLDDDTRRIVHPWADSTVIEDPADRYRRDAETHRGDRDADQPFLIVSVTEKRNRESELADLVHDRGLPVIALGGMPSRWLCEATARLIRRDGRPAVGLYSGDLDPSGLDIERVFRERVAAIAGPWHHWERVAIMPAQLRETPGLEYLFDLPSIKPDEPAKNKPAPGIDRYLDYLDEYDPDLRARADRGWEHEKKRRAPVQWELEAMDDEDLANEHFRALNNWWDDDAAIASLITEALHVDRLIDLAVQVEELDLDLDLGEQP